METPKQLSSDPQLNAYLQSLSEKELKAYEIAKSHLGMTYQYDKTIGYLSWKKNQSERKS
tara:strand:- start:62 stop:241 length:180 start_codon:yes stop_codon:yes gene_type:complete